MDQIMKAETEILGSDELHRATIQKVGGARLYPDTFDPPPRNLFRRVLHTIVGTLLSPWRVTPADEAAAREQAGVHRFRTDLAVLPAKDANVITVTFDNRSGTQAANTLNTLLGLYAERRASLYDDPQLEVVRREADAGRLAVVASDERLASFKRDHAISDYEAERTLLLNRRGQAEQSVQDARIAASEHAARLAALTLLLSGETPTIGLYTEKDADIRLQALNADLEASRAKLAVAREKYRDGSRMVTSLQADLAAHEAEQARLSHDQTLSVVREGRNPSIDPLRLDRAREIAELAAARAKLEAETQGSAQLADMLVTLDRNEAALSALQREKASADDAYRTSQRILAERHLSEAEDARRLANVRVIQPAVPPQLPRPTPSLVIAGGFILACLTGAGWIVAGYLRRPVFLTREGLASATDLPVLAVFERTREKEAVLF